MKTPIDGSDPCFEPAAFEQPLGFFHLRNDIYIERAALHTCFTFYTVGSLCGKVIILRVEVLAEHML
jgi:hypothetical protein